MSYNTIRKVRASVKAMKAKNLLPQHTIGYFDESQMKQLAYLTDLQAFKEWSCPVCHITVYGPKKLLIEHHKIHSQNRHLGDNEQYRMDYKLY